MSAPATTTIVGCLGLSGTDNCFNAGIQLPDGAIMKSITYYFTSHNAAGQPDSDDFYGEITRTKARAVGADPYAPTKSLAVAEPDNDSGNPTAITKSIPNKHELVNNRLFEYAVGICTQGPVNTTDFFGARIKYTYRTAGD